VSRFANPSDFVCGIYVISFDRGVQFLEVTSDFFRNR
jgi:hypothetical protein